MSAPQPAGVCEGQVSIQARKRKVRICPAITQALIVRTSDSILRRRLGLGGFGGWVANTPGTLTGVQSHCTQACCFKSRLVTLDRRWRHETGRSTHFTFTNSPISIKATRPRAAGWYCLNANQMSESCQTIPLTFMPWRNLRVCCLDGAFCGILSGNIRDRLGF